MNRVNTSQTASTCGTFKRSRPLTSPCMRKASTRPVSTGASMPPSVSTSAKPSTSSTASTTACSSEK